MTSPTYIFAGGGTGGHLYPALAVAQELARLAPGANIVFACSGRAIDRVVLDPTPYAVVPQPVVPLPRSLMAVPKFIASWLASRRLARRMIADLKPAAVLGLGGFAAAPIVRQAHAAGVRAAMLNPDAVPGKANQYLARYVERIFTQFESTRECFAPRHRDKVQAAGCPVRASLLGARREQAAAELGLRPDRLTLLVAGGSLGAESINRAIDALAHPLAAHADRWQLLHVTGPAKAAQPPAQAGMFVRRMEYCQRMDLAYAAADLVLCRGGAVTVAELSALGKPAVIMPYPYHADQQQKLNASQLAAAGACVVCDDRIDASANACELQGSLLAIMGDSGRLAVMAQAAARCAKPAAAADVARWLCQSSSRG
jgi:UDP-N-acetylglucosamine--N-acetylmuramyl-(pentapeptide) pyrophosphoryl-undecaprenol N-acetylglucosamine transferase